MLDVLRNGNDARRLKLTVTAWACLADFKDIGRMLLMLLNVSRWSIETKNIKVGARKKAGFHKGHILPVFLQMKPNDLAIASFIVWLTLSGLILFVLILPYVLPVESINALTPQCPWKLKYNRDCPLCGMTKSFALISHGYITEGWRIRASAPILYALFVVNEMAVMFVIGRRWITRSRHGLTKQQKTKEV
jgi:hypothetical protein